MGGQDSRPISVRSKSWRLRYHDPAIAHSWIRYTNDWVTTRCAQPGEALAPDEYEFLPAGSPITCMTCLVRSR